MKTIGCSGGSLPCLGGVGRVVEADAEDRPRPRDRGEQRDVGEGGSAPSAGVRSPDGEPVADGAARRTRRPASPRTSPARGLERRPRQEGRKAHGAGRDFRRMSTRGSAYPPHHNGRVDDERDQGRRRRDVRDLPVLRGRDARRCWTCSSSSMPDVGRSSSRTSTAGSTSTASSTPAGARAFGLRSNLAIPLGDAFCSHMAEDRGPRRVRRRARPRRLRARSTMQQRVARAAPTSACRSSSPTARASARSPALHARRGAFRAADEQLFPMLARVLSSELERESNDARPARLQRPAARPGARDRRRRPRGQRAGRRATTRAPPSARPPARSRARRSPSCSSRRAASSVSTAMAGVSVAPVTIQPRADAESGGRAFQAKETYFVADATHAPGARRSRWSRRPAPARRCSSPCCATARSPAC